MNIKTLFSDGFSFLRVVFRSKHMIYQLTKRDFNARYIQNVFGLVWSILDSLFFLLILWFVFSTLRGGKSVADVPFVAYLLTGLIPFLFFSEVLVSSTNSIRSYSFLVSKLNFRIALLPLVKLFSGIILHSIVFCVGAIILIINGIYPSLWWIQVIYFTFAAAILLLGLSWMTSAISVFFPDIGNIVVIMIRFMFYLTPVFWELKSFSEKHQIILKLNPLYYIVSGYRDSLIYHKPFWADLTTTIYFWVLCLIFMVIGVSVFKKLRPHFADVL